MSIFWSVLIVKTCSRYIWCVFTYMPPVVLLTSVFCCKVQCKNLFNIEVLLSAPMCSVRVVYKKIYIYSAARFIISDDIEEEIVVLSSNWRFPLSPFIK